MEMENANAVFCKGCIFLGQTGGYETCDYLLHTGHKRPGPAGEGCVVKDTGDAAPGERVIRDEVRPVVAGNRRSRWDTELGMELYRAGKSDVEIGKIVGVTANTILCWRRKRGLPANFAGRPAKKKEEAKEGGPLSHGCAVTAPPEGEPRTEDGSPRADGHRDDRTGDSPLPALWATSPRGGGKGDGGRVAMPDGGHEKNWGGGGIITMTNREAVIVLMQMHAEMFTQGFGKGSYTEAVAHVALTLGEFGEKVAEDD